MPRLGLSTGVAAAIGVLAASFLYGGTGRAQTATMTPTLKSLAAAAAQEGEVSLKGSVDTFGGTAGARLIAANIEKAYGTKLAVKWVPGGSFPEVGNEVAVTLRSSLPSPTDVYFGFSRNMAVFGKLGMFQTAPWQDYDPERLSDRVVEQGAYVKIYSGTLGFAYNTEQAPSKPETLADFLKPEWKGKYATTAFAAGFEQLSAKEAWGPEKTIAYAKTFAQNAGGFMLCTDSDRLASGEFLAFVTDCSGGSMLRAAKTGAPIARVITPEYPMISYFYLGVPKNAAHPNAAKLFIAYLLSAEGQKVTYDLTLNDVHFFPDSRTGPEIAAVERKFGFKFGNADVAWQETNEPGNAAQREVARIFRESGK